MEHIRRIQTDAQWNLAFWCMFYGVGIISTLVVYGILQERIMTIPFGGELFTVSAFLVLCNRIMNVLYASSMIAVKAEDFQPKAPIWKYLLISFSNVAATTCQYECLKYVSFPVQMLGKSFKMMPVMLWGMAISGKKHNSVDWMVALCVTFGVTEFCMTGPMSSPNDHGNSIYGVILLVMFLGFDGLTSTFQEKLFKEYNTSKFNQMFYINGMSAVTSLLTLIALGKLPYCLQFCAAHVDFVMSVLILSCAAAASQYFIYSQVKEYGALVFAATMNVRQVVSILFSYITYNHVGTSAQGFGLLFVFGALFWKSYLGLAASGKSVAKEKASAEERASLLPNDAQEALEPKALV